MEIKKGSRVIMSLNLEPCICKAGDKGTIVDYRYKPNANLPAAWDIKIDNGRSLYAYEDEFALDEQN